MKMNPNVIAGLLVAFAVAVIVGAWMVWGKGPGEVAPKDTEKIGRAKMEEQAKKMYGGRQQPGAPR